MAAWSKSLGRDGAWDDSLWEQMCEGYETDPAAGFGLPAFKELLRYLWLPPDEADEVESLFVRFDEDADGFLSLAVSAGPPPPAPIPAYHLQLPGWRGWTRNQSRSCCEGGS
jgi:hypothetical protein